MTRVCRLLKDVITLTRMDLGGNTFSAESAAALADALAETKVKVLDLSNTVTRKRDECQLLPVLEAMRENSHLEELDVSHCNIGEEGGSVIQQGLRAHPTMTRVRLAGNPIGQGLGSVVTWIVQNDLLESVNVSGVFKLG